MHFINNNPTDIQAVLKLITQKRLHRAIKNKGSGEAFINMGLTHFLG